MNQPINDQASGCWPLHLPCQSPDNSVAHRRSLATIVLCLIAVVVATGCASTKVSSRNRYATGQLPRPGQILVYSFAATAAEVPADSTLAREFSVVSPPQTADEIAIGRELGAQVAAQLVQEIRDLGMPAVHAMAGTPRRINDILIRGYFVSIDEGDTAKRVAIGFGSGVSELRTAVEGLQVTAQGLRKLGSGTVDSTSSKTPGAGVGAATFIASGNPAGLIFSSSTKVYRELSGKSKIEERAKATAKEIAEILQKRFREQGWID